MLLQGREDMLGLVAAQLKFKASKRAASDKKPVWVDIGGGTGYNIEAMQAYLDVPTFFSKVYLVDLSPSLLEVARKRFDRLGWSIEIVCEDARAFRLPADESRPKGRVTRIGSNAALNSEGSPKSLGAGLVTLSYSLSMIPDYYSIVDSIPSLLSPQGVLGVVDFYVQSIVEVSGRTYTGGSFNRHVTWLGRVFWRAWFDVDRVGLEGARRDYLEYRFGTLKTVDERNYVLGGIPYYSESPPISYYDFKIHTFFSIFGHTARYRGFCGKSRAPREFGCILYGIPISISTSPQGQDAPGSRKDETHGDEIQSISMCHHQFELEYSTSVGVLPEQPPSDLL